MHPSNCNCDRDYKRLQTNSGGYPRCLRFLPGPSCLRFSELEETCKLLSTMVPDALGCIATRLESQKIDGIQNLGVYT
jgi:hypothetical protein